MSNQRNVELATTTNITTTYAGEFAGEYIAAALLSASTIDDGGLTVKANIAFKEVIKKLATGNLVSPASCDFNPNSSVTLTERIIQPSELQVNLQLCKYDFVNDWEAQSMGYGLGQSLPSTPEASTTEPASVIPPKILLLSFGDITNLLFASAPVFLKNTVIPKLPLVIKGRPIVKPSVATLWSLPISLSKISPVTV